MKAGSTMWLAQYIAQTGYCARRKAINLIQKGRIRVNNDRIIHPAYRVNLTDKVFCDEMELHLKGRQTILLHKPARYITSCFDPQGRPLVKDLLPTDMQHLYPIGRLDYHTSGLLLLTNDGSLALRLAHPRYQVHKVYVVTLAPSIPKEELTRWKEGVRLSEGVVHFDEVKRIDLHTLQLTLHSGWNRVIRRVCKQMGYQVKRLVRINYGPLSRQGLPPGKWRRLEHAEVNALYHLIEKRAP